MINFANCFQNGPQKASKEAKEGRLGKGVLGGSERVMGISIISYGKNSLHLRPI
jgi:hypothetical protein